MLVVGVRLGKDVIIGDHTVVTVTHIDRETNEVKLGVDSEFMVKRASNPATTMMAAKVRAKAKLCATKRFEPISKLPVHVASYVQDNEPKIKAALSSSKASFPGSKMSTLSDETSLNLASHQFVVIRCATETEKKMARWTMNQVMGWPILDELEANDSTHYLLTVRTVAEKQGGDVAYYDACNF